MKTKSCLCTLCLLNYFKFWNKNQNAKKRRTRLLETLKSGNELQKTNDIAVLIFKFETNVPLTANKRFLTFNRKFQMHVYSYYNI